MLVNSHIISIAKFSFNIQGEIDDKKHFDSEKQPATTG